MVSRKESASKEFVVIECLSLRVKASEKVLMHESKSFLCSARRYGGYVRGLGDGGSWKCWSRAS